MDNKLKQVFQKASYEPEINFSGDIWRNIKIKESRVYKIKIILNSIFGILSFVLLFPSISNLITQFNSQGFSEYVSLVFSDFNTISTYWKEFALSIVNSLPLASIALSFFLLFVLFNSTRRVVGQFRSKLLLA